MTAVNERLPVWRVYRGCLRAWRRDFWRLAALATIVLLPLLLVAVRPRTARPASR